MSQKLIGKEISAIAVVLFGFVSSIIQIYPPNDIGVVTAWHFYPSLGRLKTTFGALLVAYYPLPEYNLFFWNSSAFLSNAHLVLLISIILAGLVFIICRFLSFRPSALFLYILVSFSLLLFFYTKYTGDLRHHGFLFIALISALWIHAYCDERKLFPVLRSPTSVDRRIFQHVISALFAAQMMAGVVAMTLEYKHTFSGAKETAHFIEQNGLAKMNIIGYSRFNSLAVAGYLINKEFFYPEQERFGTFGRWDNSSVRDLSLNLLVSTARNLSMDGSGVIFVSSRRIEEFGSNNSNFVKLFESDDTIVRDEKFYIYRFTEAP